MKGKLNDSKAQANQGASQGDTQIGPEDDATAIDYATEIAQRDTRIAEANERIAELEVALEAAGEKSEELETCNEILQTENEQLKAQAEADRMNFELALAGCRNVKAAHAVLDDYNGDVEALKSAEPGCSRPTSMQPARPACPTRTTARTSGAGAGVYVVKQAMSKVARAI